MKTRLLCALKLSLLSTKRAPCFLMLGKEHGNDECKA